MEFQVISWEARDVTTDDGTAYNIYMFGRTKDGESVACKTEFRPYFFVEVPEHWTEMNSMRFRDMLDSKYSKNLKNHIVDIVAVKRKKFYGFTNDRLFKFIRITFKSKKAFSYALYNLKKSSYRDSIFEANIDPILRFIHIQNLESTGWVSVSDYERVETDNETFCTHELFVNKWRNVRPVRNDEIGPVQMASFDIETYSADGSFPDPLSTTNRCPIIQIATTFQRHGETEPYKRSLITLKESDPIDGVEITECRTERDLILSWTSLIQTEDPDILVGYNIWKFDLSYIHKRAYKMEIDDRFNINRFNTDPSKLYPKKFCSSAYGDNTYDMVESIGRMQIDLLELYKREHKLVKYSLDAVSEHFLGDKKVDMPIREMFDKFRTGSKQDMADIGMYCVKDTELPLRLMQKLANLPNLVEMAKVTHVPMNYLIERGQQIKVFSQITKETRLDGMLVKTVVDEKTNESFVGATVLDAKKGAYMDRVVTGLDFASLYPSIMRAHNLCYNTIVLQDEYKNIPGVEYETVEWVTTTNDTEKKHSYKFAQTTVGILPKILENLAKSRKQAKKDMALASERHDEFMKSVYNGKQLAFKVSMNSIYGFCAAFMLPCQPISASVTTIGRNMIEQTKTLVEKWYPGSEVVYGDTDSVMVIFKSESTDGKQMLADSFKLGEEAADRISKTFKQPIELEFEKCYFPYLLFSKKRYAGLMYTNPKTPDYIDAKGITLVRRDNTEFVRNTSKQVLNMIMYDRQITEAMAYVQSQGKRLLDGEVPVNELIVSKSLKSISYKPGGKTAYQKGRMVYDGYDRETNIHSFSQSVLDKKTNTEIVKPVTPPPHVYLAYKTEQRNPGEGPRSGTRLPYVFVETGDEKALQCYKAEDPQYASDNKLRLDVLYYLEHSLMNPVESLFELFVDDPLDDLFGDMIREFKIQNGMVIKKTKEEKRIEKLEKIELIKICSSVHQNGRACTAKAKADSEYCGRHQIRRTLMETDEPPLICKANNKAGKGCAFKAKPGTLYCGRHQIAPQLQLCRAVVQDNVTCTKDKIQGSEFCSAHQITL